MAMTPTENRIAARIELAAPQEPGERGDQDDQPQHGRELEEERPGRGEKAAGARPSPERRAWRAEKTAGRPAG